MSDTYTGGLRTGQLQELLGLTYRQVNYTARGVPSARQGPMRGWVWPTDEVQRWQVGRALHLARTGLEVSERTDQISLRRAVRAAYAGPPPRPCSWVAYSGGAVSYLDASDTLTGYVGTVFLVPMPRLWPSISSEVSP